MDTSLVQVNALQASSQLKPWRPRAGVFSFNGNTQVVTMSSAPQAKMKKKENDKRREICGGG